MSELTETSQFLIRHGLPLVFAAVFVEQMGLPIPALPLLLAAGALSAAGKFSFPLGIAATVIACLNHVDVHPSLDLALNRNVNLNLNWDWFWRENTHDCIYGPA